MSAWFWQELPQGCDGKILPPGKRSIQVAIWRAVRSELFRLYGKWGSSGSQIRNYAEPVQGVCWYVCVYLYMPTRGHKYLLVTVIHINPHVLSILSHHRWFPAVSGPLDWPVVVVILGPGSAHSWTRGGRRTYLTFRQSCRPLITHALMNVPRAMITKTSYKKWYYKETHGFLTVLKKNQSSQTLEVNAYIGILIIKKKKSEVNA